MSLQLRPSYLLHRWFVPAAGLSIAFSAGAFMHVWLTWDKTHSAWIWLAATAGIIAVLLLNARHRVMHRLAREMADQRLKLLERVENAMKQATDDRERLRCLSQTPVVGTLVFDPHTFFCIEFNDAIVKQLGYTPEEFANQTIFALEASQPRDQVIHRLRECLGGTACTFKTLLHTRDGQLRHMRVHAQPIMLGGKRLVHWACLDITESANGRQQLAKVRQRVGLIGSTLPGFVFDWRISAHAVERNGGDAALLGVAPSELGTDLQAWQSRIHPKDLARYRRTINETFHDDGELYCVEYRVRREDGEYVYVCERGRVLRDRFGQPLRVIGTVLDVTQRRELEMQLVDSRRKAEQAQAAAESAASTKEQLIAVLSHELRTPLTPVLALAQMLDGDTSLPPGIRENIAVIRRNVEREVGLVDDLLDLTRINRGRLSLHFEAVDLHERIRHICRTLRPELRAKAMRLTLKLEAHSSTVQADNQRLQQVLSNLLTNSIKFTPVGGQITVTTRIAPDQRIVLMVEDNGIGIAEETLPRIFDAFEQDDSSREFGGLGLGLAITRGIVRMHGGTIEAQSEGLGHGATFTVTLPVSAVATKRKSNPGAAQHSSARVLLVEDHPDTAQVMLHVLRRMGYSVQHADSVNAALQAATSGSFDLLVSDLGLPDGTGHDLIRQLLESRRISGGIALSGYGMEDDIRRSRDAGFAAHLTKPVNLAQLTQTLKALADNCPQPAATVLPSPANQG